MEFDDWVEHFYHQSKALEQELPTREELTYMCWMADNRTILGKGHATMIEGELDGKKMATFNLDMYKNTQEGTLPLSDFISA